VAKSSKSKSKKPETDEQIIDAVEVSEDVDQSSDDAQDVPEGATTEVAPENLEMEIVEDRPDMEPAESAVEPEVEAAPEPAPVEKQSSGFFPLLLGGVAAGAIGYGIATYFPMSGATSEFTDQLAAQAEQIAALEAQVAGLPTIDVSALESQITTIAEQSDAAVDALANDVGTQITDIDARLLEVEKRPGVDGTLSDTALAAYQRELEELRAELDASQENVMSAAAQAEADLAEARAEAARLETEAVAAAEAAAARAALNRIATAVETGAPFSDALADLEGADVPAALGAAASTGVATTAQLVDAFPAAARSALATARAEGLSDDAGGLVLSRAEAAVKEGRVADALAELEALPEVARAELTDWTARASERSDVLDAIATLSETYN